MGSHTDFNVPRVVGDTSADRPTAPAKDTDFFAKDTGISSFFTGGSWRSVLPAITSVATVTALAAIAVAARYDRMVVTVSADNSVWIFNGSSSLTGDNLLVVTPDTGSGRWVRLPMVIDLALPVTAGTVSGGTLLTFRSGMRFIPMNLYWEVSVAFTGGSSSTVGVASNKTGFGTAGDLLGGAAGDLAAVLTVGVTAGTIGVGINSVAKLHSAVFVSGDTILWNNITSAYTTGVGNVHLTGQLIKNTG